MTPYRDRDDVSALVAILDAHARVDDARDSLEEAREAYLDAVRVHKDALRAKTLGVSESLCVGVGIVAGVFVTVAVALAFPRILDRAMAPPQCEDTFSSDTRYVECRGGARMQVTPTGILCTCPRDGGAP